MPFSNGLRRPDHTARILTQSHSFALLERSRRETSHAKNPQSKLLGACGFPHGLPFRPVVPRLSLALQVRSVQFLCIILRRNARHRNVFVSCFALRRHGLDGASSMRALRVLGESPNAILY